MITLKILDFSFKTHSSAFNELNHLAYPKHSLAKHEAIADEREDIRHWLSQFLEDVVSSTDIFF